MKDCIFCKIVSEQAHCHKLYEDDLVIAFLDRSPASNGHIIVIPKDHFENIFETPDNILERINITCKKLALLCKSRLHATGVNILNASGRDAQQSIFHLHYHVVPRYEKDGLDMWFTQEPKEQSDLNEILRILSS